MQKKKKINSILKKISPNHIKRNDVNINNYVKNEK